MNFNQYCLLDQYKTLQFSSILIWGWSELPSSTHDIFNPGTIHLQPSLEPRLPDLLTAPRISYSVPSFESLLWCLLRFHTGNCPSAQAMPEAEQGHEVLPCRAASSLDPRKLILEPGYYEIHCQQPHDFFFIFFFWIWSSFSKVKIIEVSDLCSQFQAKVNIEKRIFTVTWIAQLLIFFLSIYSQCQKTWLVSWGQRGLPQLTLSLQPWPSTASLPAKGTPHPRFSWGCFAWCQPQLEENSGKGTETLYPAAYCTFKIWACLHKARSCQK